MTYPITFEEISLNHKGGTKSYFLTILCNAAGRCVVIARYGKTGTFGQFTVKRFHSASEGEKEFSAKLKEKTRGGYEPIGQPTRPSDKINSSTELKSFLGRAMAPTFGADNYLHLDDSMDVSGIKSSTVDYDEAGYKVDNTKRSDPAAFAAAQKAESDRKQAIIDAEARRLEDIARTEKEETLAALQKLPTFGMF